MSTLSGQTLLLDDLEAERRLMQPPFYSVFVMGFDELDDGSGGILNDWQPEWIGITKWEIRHALNVLYEMGYCTETILVERVGWGPEMAKAEMERDAKFTNTRKRDR